MTPPVATRPELRLPPLWVLAAFLIFFAVQQIAGLAAYLVDGEIETSQLFFSPWYMGAALISNVVLVAVLWWIARRTTPDARACLGLVRPAAWGRAIGVSIAAVFAGFVIAVALEPILHGGEEQGLDPVAFPGGAEATIGVAIAVVALTIGAPIAEELCFRGGIFAAARYRMGFPLTALLSGLAFGAVHLVPAAFPALMLFGVVLAVVYERTGSILPAMLTHGIYNGIALAAALSA